MINIDNSKFDLFLHKCFDIKLKEGHTMSSAVIDEKNYLTTFYFLKNSRVYSIDIPSKKLDELSFSKNHEVFYITGNANNEYLICVFKNGKIFAININKKIFYLKNLQNENTSNSNKFDSSFKIYASNNLDKVVVYTSSQITVWYKSIQKEKITSSKKINELLGFHIYIQLKEERKAFLTAKDKIYKDDFICYFGNNYYLGSFIRICYFLLVPQPEKNTYKLIIITYLFFFDKENKLRSLDNIDINEYKTKFTSRYLCSYFLSVKPPVLTETNKDDTVSQNTLPKDKEKSDDKPKVNQNKTIISKINTTGTIIAIALNFKSENTCNLIFYQTEVFKFSSFNLNNISMNKEDEDISLLVEDLEWLCNDLYVAVFFTGGYFTIMNTSYQMVLFYDFSNNISRIENTNLLYIPSIFAHAPYILTNQKIKVIASRQKTDYFVIYASNIIIGFQCSSQSYIDRRINNEISSFDDFLSDLRFYQVALLEDENQKDILFDKLNNFVVQTFNDIFVRGDNDGLFQTEGANSLMKFFVKFILIYRNVNLLHETNLPILSYFLNVSNDFFIYLLKLKEIWLSFLFIELVERYLLKMFRLKNIKGKRPKSMKLINEYTNILFNPFYVSNVSLKCYNKINNNTILSKWRLILIVYCLIEFRSNQALNINVLYFILGKLTSAKLIKHNLLDDIHFILKIIIRNWKYLKNENLKAGGEEYVLNGLTMNHRTELMSQFLHTKISKNDNFNIDFLGEFFTVDELNNYLSINRMYCYGDEEELLNEYSYMNNLGEIQKWILFFTNGLYPDLFEDLKDYLGNHLKQTVDFIMKKEENISPDELNLSRLVYFNIYFISLCMMNLIGKILVYLNKNKDIVHNKKLFKFLCPIDVPFLLYEFFSDSNTANNQIDLEILLQSYFERYQKNFTFTFNDSLDFADFLSMKGFKLYTDNIDDMNNNLEIIKKTPVQNYTYTFQIFYLMLIHKTNSLFFLDDYEPILYNISLLDVNFRKDLYEMYLLIMNGYIRYFVSKDDKNKLIGGKPKTINPLLIEKNICLLRYDSILILIKKIFYKIIYEEDCFLRKDICDFIKITQDYMKFPFMEGMLYHEYKFFKSLSFDYIFDFNDILKYSEMNKNLKVQNFFEMLCSNNCSNTIFEIIFGGENTQLKDKISLSLKNIIQLLLNIDKSTNFSYEVNTETINNIFQFNNNDISIVDQVITGDINKYKQTFGESSYTNNVILSLKKIIIKIVHCLNILYIKYKILTINPIQDTMNYLKLLSFCLIFDKSEEQFMIHHNLLMQYLCIAIQKEGFLKNDINVKKLNDILLFTNLSFITHETKPTEQYSQLELLFKKKNEKGYNQFITYKKNHLLLVNKYLNKAEISTSKCIRIIVISITLPFYLKITNVVLNQLRIFSIAMSSINKNLPFQFTREKYAILNEAFAQLTGVNSNSFIEFNDNWDLIHCHPIYEMIISDPILPKMRFQKEKFELLLTERQKLKIKMKKKNSYKIPNSVINLCKDKLNIKNEISSKEIEIKEVEKNNKPLRIRIPVDIENDDIEITINQNIEPIPIKRLIPHRRKTPIERFIIRLKRIFFHELINQIFQKYKKKISGEELEEIKIIRVTPKEGSVKIAKLKEKYISTKDLIKAQKNDTHYLSSLRFYDIINVNKYEQGKSENSKIFQELVSTKRTKKISETIKSKLQEYSEKIRHYEYIVKSLSNEFNAKK